MIVEKAGEIIPYVIGPVLEARTGAEKKYVTPAACPVCGSPTTREAGKPKFICTGGVTCPAQLEKKLESYAKRERMDIEGLGESIIKQLVKDGLVKSVTDLYRLTLDQLVKLEHMGKNRRRTCSTASR